MYSYPMGILIGVCMEWIEGNTLENKDETKLVEGEKEEY